jgi:predicted SprT family Zn-dependent metalloprotease
MTDRQNIFVKSVDVTLDACDKNPDSVNLIPIMSVRIARTRQLLKDFFDLELLVMDGVRGIREDKQARREKAETEIGFGYNALESYAIEIKDIVLQEMAHYSAWTLSKMNGITLIEAGENLVEKLNGVDAADLANEGFEASDLVSLQDSINGFNEWLVKPEVAIKTRSARVEERNAKFKLLVAYVKGPLDTTGKLFKKRDPRFYSLYKICRKLHLQGSRKKKEEKAEPVI